MNKLERLKDVFKTPEEKRKRELEQQLEDAKKLRSAIEKELQLDKYPIEVKDDEEALNRVNMKIGNLEEELKQLGVEEDIDKTRNDMVKAHERGDMKTAVSFYEDHKRKLYAQERDQEKKEEVDMQSQAEGQARESIYNPETEEEKIELQRKAEEEARKNIGKAFEAPKEEK